MQFSLEPEFIVDHEGRIHRGVVVFEVHKGYHIADHAPPLATRVFLKGKMLVPGFVNVHSHALQRALRGRVETRSPSGQDTFWSWRTLMYRDVNQASLEDIKAIATLAYLEMLQAGFVGVGEFHYLHHDFDGKPYKDTMSTSRCLVEAAESVGIRLTLMPCAYERKNHREALLMEQRRFGFESASKFLAYAEHIHASLASRWLNHGLAIHSTRACSREWILEIASSALASEGPLHVHASEQKQEVEESFLEHGFSPIEALSHFHALSDRTTLIHATHLSHKDIEVIAQSKALVGLCPSTERNLGDGLCPVFDLLQKNVPLCMGTDQHVRLDPVNELREIEEQERLRLQRRCIVAEPGLSIAGGLLPIGTINGRRSLGLHADAADFVAIRLDETYEAAGPLAALNAHFIAGTHRDVTDVFVDGVHQIKDGVPLADSAEIKKEALRALKSLASA